MDMEDHRDEDFSKPKVAFKAFGGEGQKLGRWVSSILIEFNTEERNEIVPTFQHNALIRCLLHLITTRG